MMHTFVRINGVVFGAATNPQGVDSLVQAAYDKADRAGLPDDAVEITVANEDCNLEGCRFCRPETYVRI